MFKGVIIRTGLITDEAYVDYVVQPIATTMRALVRFGESDVSFREFCEGFSVDQLSIMKCLHVAKTKITKFDQQITEVQNKEINGNTQEALPMFAYHNIEILINELSSFNYNPNEPCVM